MNSMNDFERVNRNLYKKDKKYFRLFGHGITPNNCWIIAPKMIELVDIDIASGNDVYGDTVIEFDCVGTVSAYYEYIRLK